MAVLRVVEERDMKRFLQSVGPWLGQREAFNNVILGVAQAILRGRGYGEQAPLGLIAQRDKQIAGALLCTPPYAATLTATDQEAASALCRWLSTAPWPISSLNVPRVYRLQAEEVLPFQLVGEAALRVFELRELQSPRVPGQSRVARSEDLPLLTRWLDAFEQEVGLHDGLRAQAGAWLQKGGVELWEDRSNKVVAMAVRNRELPRGASVGPVYTPPECRGHGYASAVTAAVSAKILASGKEYCCLFSDIDNPVSNRIYTRLGYRALGDWLLLKF